MKRAALWLCVLFCSFCLLSAAEQAPESRLVYLYVPACGSCAKAEALIESLGEAVEVEGADGSLLRSKLSVERVDLSRDPQRARELFALFETPEEQQIAPSVYFGKHYLAGAEAILSSLPEALRKGQALEAPLERTGGADKAPETSGLSLGAALVAGLIAGLNPCALSMLILLLGSILHLGRRSAGLAAVYLASKLLTYFLIGLVFLRLLQFWNPFWLPIAVKALLSVFALIFIILNLMDALRAARGEYGKVKNQLPSSLRTRLQGFIRRMADSPHLVWAMALLGVAVSLGEFLCAGQVYLASLLSWINTGAKDARKLLLLAAYCLSFIVPSLLVTAFVLRLRHTLEASDFIRRRMPAIKLLSAAALLMAALYAWLG